MDRDLLRVQKKEINKKSGIVFFYYYFSVDAFVKLSICLSLSLWASDCVMSLSIFISVSVQLGLFFPCSLPFPPFFPPSAPHESRLVNLYWIQNSLPEAPPWAQFRERICPGSLSHSQCVRPTQTCCNLTFQLHRFPQVPHFLLQSLVFQTITFHRMCQGQEHWFSMVTHVSAVNSLCHPVSCFLSGPEKE